MNDASWLLGGGDVAVLNGPHVLDYSASVVVATFLDIVEHAAQCVVDVELAMCGKLWLAA